MKRRWLLPDLMTPSKPKRRDNKYQTALAGYEQSLRQAWGTWAIEASARLKRIKARG